MNNTTKLLVTIFIALSLCVSAAFSAEDVSSFAFKMNGHKHNMEQDFVDRAVQEWYDVAMDSFDLTSFIDSLAQEYGLTITDFYLPEDIRLAYEVDSTGVNDFQGTVVLDSLNMIAYGYGCRFDIDVLNMGLRFGGVAEFDSGQFQIDLNEPEIIEPVILVSDSGGVLCPTLAGILVAGLNDAAKQYLNELAVMFETLVSDELFVFLNPIASLGIDDPELLSAALQSFPLDMALYTEYDTNQGIVQLVEEINFLLGTTENPTAFINIEPEQVAGSRLTSGGFSFIYWSLQRGFMWHTEWDESQRVNAAFGIMDELDINGYRIETRWKNVQKKAYLGADLDPADITPDQVESFLADSEHWDTTGFANVQNILDNGFARELTPFMLLGMGLQDGLPLTENGKIIAPATPDWEPADGFVGVSGNEYLYNLKIYALATVRRFANQVDVWQAENELNAAGWTAAFPEWWRKGDLWLDADFRDRVWAILVDAIRSEDPTAQITTGLHILGFMSSLERWVDDLDIVGFNYYPNLSSALPVLGFSVGEYVWAIRRVLKGLDYPDKQVWLLETGYPGIETDDPPDSILLTDDAMYFSENRQQEYIETALTSSVENGINGFYYFNLTAPENFGSGGPELDKYLRFCGLIRRDTDEQKIALSPFANLYNRLLLKTGIVRNNKMLPQSLILHQNYPNPFNPETIINYQLPKISRVKISVFNIRGQLVQILENGVREAGYHTVRWDGCNEMGSKVVSGIYLYRIKAGEFVCTKKMALMK
ncbi:T9SS type A sorting domain-containing protein [candidate division KSB1 bacterium]|nr:T9SS type A sorting domain-containing protein [candidate division KSB1 bacterium]MBL7092505.1 T9SS type A sorting domain-containing protein [candidate division KSB1 bacterium]